MHVNPEDWDADFAFPNFNLTLCVAIWPVMGQGVKTLNDRQSHIL